MSLSLWASFGSPAAMNITVVKLSDGNGNPWVDACVCVPIFSGRLFIRGAGPPHFSVTSFGI